jgi:hypothetical protein
LYAALASGATPGAHLDGLVFDSIERIDFGD